MPSGQICLGNPVADHPLNQGLLGWWLPLAQGSGKVLFDLTNKRHATLGTQYLTQTGPTQGSLALFSSTSSSSAATFTSTGVLSQYTVSWWGYVTSVANYGTAFSNSSGNVLIMTSTSGTPQQMYLKVKSSGSGSTYTPNHTNRSLDKWQHFAVTFVSGGDIWSYVDGVGVYCGSTTGTAFFSTLCHTNSAYPWLGNITDFRIYNRALSGAEVSLLYTQGLQGYPNLLRRSPRLMSRVAMFGSGDVPASIDGAASLSVSLSDTNTGRIAYNSLCSGLISTSIFSQSSKSAVASSLPSLSVVNTTTPIKSLGSISSCLIQIPLIGDARRAGTCYSSPAASISSVFLGTGLKTSNSSHPIVLSVAANSIKALPGQSQSNILLSANTGPVKMAAGGSGLSSIFELQGGAIRLLSGDTDANIAFPSVIEGDISLDQMSILSSISILLDSLGVRQAGGQSLSSVNLSSTSNLFKLSSGTSLPSIITGFNNTGTRLQSATSALTKGVYLLATPVKMPTSSFAGSVEFVSDVDAAKLLSGHAHHSFSLTASQMASLLRSSLLSSSLSLSSAAAASARFGSGVSIDVDLVAVGSNGLKLSQGVSHLSIRITPIFILVRDGVIIVSYSFSLNVARNCLEQLTINRLSSESLTLATNGLEDLTLG